jgi:hypothetical protein
VVKKVEKPTIEKIVLKKRKEPSMPAGSCPYCGREHQGFVSVERTEKEAYEILSSVETRTYRKAAIATIKKLEVINKKPIGKALHDIRRYEEYLIRENHLEGVDLK